MNRETCPACAAIAECASRIVWTFVSRSGALSLRSLAVRLSEEHDERVSTSLIAVFALFQKTVARLRDARAGNAEARERAGTGRSDARVARGSTARD